LEFPDKVLHKAGVRLVADLLEPLLDIPSDQWSFDQIIYEVQAR
jgi:hypothetical protein